jgi:hypothetical protein
VRHSLTSDINCALVAQMPLSDIGEGECRSLELSYFFATETGNNPLTMTTSQRSAI